MKFLFIYGLPGSGKLTISKEIVNLLGDEFKIFHNQMTVDIISQFFKFATPVWSRLNGQFRRLMFEACAEEGINLISTFVYAHDYEGDRDFVKDIIDLVERNGGEVLFVNLVCDEEIVFQRIQNPDRKKHRKVSEPHKLKDTMNKWDLLTPIDFVDNLTVDSGKLSAKECAKSIIAHYNLSE